MKFLTAISVALLALSSTMGLHDYKKLAQHLPSSSEKQEEITDFEKAVQMIKKYEGKHTSMHWPFVGYGHLVQKGDNIPRGRQLTEKEADALLRKDLLANCAKFREFGADSLLLGMLAYNIGPGATARSSVVKKLRAGDRDIYNSFIAHSRYKGKVNKQIQRRRIEEYNTFFVQEKEDPDNPGKKKLIEQINTIVVQQNLDSLLSEAFAAPLNCLTAMSHTCQPPFAQSSSMTPTPPGLNRYDSAVFRTTFRAYPLDRTLSDKRSLLTCI